MRIKNKNQRQGIRRLRQIRLFAGLNTGIAVLLAIVLCGLINFIAAKHYWRIDVSNAKQYSLSEKSKSLLRSLSDEVKIIVFFQKSHSLYSDIENLLKEYRYVTKRIKVKWIDPDRDIALTEEFASKYGVVAPNVIVFASRKSTKLVTDNDILGVDYRLTQFGQTPQANEFRGEQAFSSAIMSVTQKRRPVIYFMSGHGERDCEDHDPQRGYSAIARHIRYENLEVKSLIFGEQQSVPNDCDVLIIAGPTKIFSDAEIGLISEFLNRNGRLMILIDSYTNSGIGKLLQKWGVSLRADVVVDPTRTLSGSELFITKYSPHQITKELEGMTTIFHQPRSVYPLEPQETDTADKPQVAVLAGCTVNGWAETSLSQDVIEYDAETDIAGPVSVAVAVERGPVANIDVRLRPTRLVVFGDSDFISNGAMTGGDVDLFMNSLNWLLEREELMKISPKPYEEIRLTMTNKQLNLLFVIMVLGIPVSVILCGCLVWLWRRN